MIDNYAKKRIKSVAKTKLEQHVAEWLCDRVDYDGDPCELLSDLLHNGCAAVVGELVYYEDTTKFYLEHREDIWNLVIDRAEKYWSNNPFEFLGRLNHGNLGSVYQVESFLAWFGFEEAARNIQTALEKLDESDG